MEAGRSRIRVIGGRYGLSSKEFTPAMVKAVFDELAAADAQEPLHHRHQRRRHPHQPRYDPSFTTESPRRGAGDVLRSGRRRHGGRQQELHQDHRRRDADNYAQGYFVYDSKKSGAITVSHLRFGPRPIQLDLPDRPCQLRRLPSVVFLERYDMLENAEPGATFLLNSPYGPDEVWDQLPAHYPGSRSSTSI